MPLTTIPGPAAQVLKTETARAHGEAENVLLPALQSIHSLSAYATVLKAFYGFFHPLEERIRQHIGVALLPDIEQRRNAALIKKDLDGLGFSTDAKQCTSLPEITGVAQAFGALYVLEGSTLGGRMIARMLSKNASVNIPAGALHFFNGYKEETGNMWTDFLVELNKQQNVPGMVAAANETFYQLKSWMKDALVYEATS